MEQPQARVINAVAPIRICDLGGWTDTWFAGHGVLCNFAVYPYAEVQIHVSAAAADQPRITINAENFGDRYDVDPGRIQYDRHPLLEASLDIMALPASLSFEVNLYSQAPVGCSTGTSAAVTVALLGALDLLTPGRRTAHEIAALAHRVETEKLGLQCGIQDQLCASHGGICFIEMHDYPHASVSRVDLADDLWWELERRLVLVYLGSAHASSRVHGQVIERLEAPGADTSALEALRQAARDGKNALCEGEFNAFGRCMIDNTAAQAALHAALISPQAQAVIDLAREHGAVGWKVNGAGGAGGSVTVLCGAHNEHKRRFLQALPAVDPRFQVLPIHLSRTGVRRWEARP